MRFFADCPGLARLDLRAIPERYEKIDLAKQIARRGYISAILHLRFLRRHLRHIGSALQKFQYFGARIGAVGGSRIGKAPDVLFFWTWQNPLYQTAALRRQSIQPVHAFGKI